MEFLPKEWSRFDSRTHLARSLLVVPALLVALAAPAQSEEFGYACETCPTNWGDLDDAFAACADSTAQSPIAFSPWDARPGPLHPVRVRFEQTSLEVEVLATNFEALVEGGSFKLGPKRFELVQFHFHNPSEHVVAGERTPLELHFVHRDEDGGLAVLAVFIVEGDANPEIDALIEVLPGLNGEGDFAEVEGFDPSALMPSRRGTFRYQGSTTTPPCAGGVQWIAFARLVEFSEEQIEAIATKVRELNDGFGNNRPIQERNGRTIETENFGFLDHRGTPR